jgi:hypothetical protein
MASGNHSIIAGWAVIATMLCQFIPLERTNPPARMPEGVPAEVGTLLRQKCGACHSYRTVWPESAYVAPLSWYVVSRVGQARTAMNLSVQDAAPGYTVQTWQRSTRRLFDSGSLERHGRIPGFTPPSLDRHERKMLRDWSVEPDNGTASGNK